MSVEFGTVLKSWRHERRMSQLDLGLTADVSARHISFLETGRSRPSRDMVLRLCEHLEVPLAARNRLLTAAGLAPAYAGRDLGAADMAPVREAVGWMLERHDPYPAFAVDRHWVLVRLNRSAATLLAGLGLTEGASLLEALAGDETFRRAIDNLDEVLAYGVARLRTEIAHLGGDPVLEAAAERLEASPSGPVLRRDGVMPAFVPMRISTGGAVLSFFSTIAQFGTAEDIAVAEMRIEMMFPADDATRGMLLGMAAG